MPSLYVRELGAGVALAAVQATGIGHSRPTFEQRATKLYWVRAAAAAVVQLLEYVTGELRMLQ